MIIFHKVFTLQSEKMLLKGLFWTLNIIDRAAHDQLTIPLYKTLWLDIRVSSQVRLNSFFGLLQPYTQFSQWRYIRKTIKILICIPA